MSKAKRKVGWDEPNKQQTYFFDQMVKIKAITDELYKRAVPFVLGFDTDQKWASKDRDARRLRGIIVEMLIDVKRPRTQDVISTIITDNSGTTFVSDGAEHREFKQSSTRAIANYVLKLYRKGAH